MHLKIITFQKLKESMKGFNVKIVNKGLLGEPEHLCFQSTETNRIIEFSQIVNIVDITGESYTADIANSDITNPHIQNILNNYGHTINLNYLDDGCYEIIF